MVTAGHLLQIYRVRRDMQRDGITNPPFEVKSFCEDLVLQLEALDPAEKVDLRQRGDGGIDFIAGGKVLATLPPDKDLQ